MKHIVTFSGGKDSLDTIIWAQNNLAAEDWEVVFCDTDWEDELTYQHIREVEAKIGKPVKVLRHDPFPISDASRESIRQIFGKDCLFAEMVVYKSRFPSTKARFCTEELKSKPMIDFVLTLNEDTTILQGVRADESQARRNLKEKDDYFKFYFEPYKIDKKGKKKYHSYRTKEVKKRSELFDTKVYYPVLRKTAEEIFESIYKNGFKPNPLYKMLMGRVGCFPCIMCQKSEIKQVAIIRPLRIVQLEALEALEALTNSTFFPPGYIPIRFCTKMAKVRLYLDDLLDTRKPNLYNPSLHQSLATQPTILKHTDEDGDIYVIKTMPVPTINDVVKYVSDNPDQQSLFEPMSGCMSVYNICETGK